MEEYLALLFKKDGIAIFHTDYKLFLKLLEKYPKGNLRRDAYYVNLILGGNFFYKSVMTALENDNHEVSHAEYNVIVAQMYSADRFWERDIQDPTYCECLLRMLYKVASVNTSKIPMIIIQNEQNAQNNEVLIDELNSAENSYEDKNYSIALEKSKMLFKNGVSFSASRLGRMYFSGNGTPRDYNKALFYLSYPHQKTRKQDEEERAMIEELLGLRDKTMYTAIIGLLGSVVLFLFMVTTSFFSRHIGFAIFNTALLVAISVLFISTYKKRLIFDFSYFFFILGVMLLIVLIL